MTHSSNRFIGVFDSGFGGLSILKDIQKELSQYQYVYLGDTARTPYGTRSRELVCTFTMQAVDFLFGKGCDLIIIACNTASASALRKIQQEYLPVKYPGKRVLGVIIPAVEEAVEKTKTCRIGVLATPGTVQSNAFFNEIHKRDPRVKVFQQACPLLVPLVEAGAYGSAAGKLILRDYLEPVLHNRIDTLILGCTHYGLLESSIRTFIPRHVNLVSEGRIVARKLKDYLTRHPEIESRLAHSGGMTLYTTDLTDYFKRLGSIFLGKPINPKRIELI